jgi:hypothetical protein
MGIFTLVLLKSLCYFYRIELCNYLLSLNIVTHNIDSGQFGYGPFGDCHLNFIRLF